MNKCAHCHLPSNDIIIDGDLTFCCKGCQGVYHLLQESGLNSFYDKLGDRAIAAPLTDYDNAHR
ncbi:MAG: cytochrome oxidase maturation protein cbb3-type, partial [Pseudomonadota bacterium]